MKSPCDRWFSHIDITNKCHIGNCIYCSRFLRHIRKDMFYEMNLDQIEKALISYEGFPNRIGIIGGEPLLHSAFPEICELLLKYNSASKYGLWTSMDPKFSKFSKIIDRTFGFVAFHQHTVKQRQLCRHQPLTIALKDSVKDPKLRKDLIKECYFGNNWCATITPLGAYFCEIGAFIAYLQGIKGWPVEKGWWKRKVSDFGYQLEFCELCGGAVPMKRQYLKEETEEVSKSFLKILEEHKLPKNKFELIKTPFTKRDLEGMSQNWKPGAYRGDLGEQEEWGGKIDWKKYED